MNTTAARYTPLESLLLFQSLLAHGIDAASFLRISDLLRNNHLVKNSADYDAARLGPDRLQELFLHLLQDELKAESNNAEKPDHPGLSPNSRKRKLASPPLPTLLEARQHITKLPVLVNNLYARYRDHAIREIREDEELYDGLQAEIEDIEQAYLAERQQNDARASARKSPSPAVAATGLQDEARLPNGGSRAQIPLQQQPLLQPKPQPQVHSHVQAQAQSQPRPQPQLHPQPQAQFQPPSHPQPPPQPRPQPRQQSTVGQDERRNGAPSPRTQLQPLEPGNAVAIAGIAAQPPVVPQDHQPSRVVASPAVRPQEPTKPASGPPQVLQPPQGVGFLPPRQPPTPQHIQGEGLQRPEGIGRPKAPTVLHPNQPQVPGQLKWEPLYQPNQNNPQHRQPPIPGSYPAPKHQHPASQGPHGHPVQQQQTQTQWNAQNQSPYGSPRPLQAHPGPQQGQTMQQPVQQPLQQQPMQLPMQQSVQQPAQQPTQQSMQPPTQQPTQQAAQQTLQQPVLLAPQHPSRFPPSLQPAPLRSRSEAAPVPAQSRSPAPSPGPAPGRPPQAPYATQPPYPNYAQPPQSRPLVAASPTPPSAPPQGPLIPQQRTHTPQPINYSPQSAFQVPGPTASTLPAIPSGDFQNGYGTTYNLPPRSAIPEHVLQQPQQQQQLQRLAAATPTPPSRMSPIATAPQTPVPGFPFQSYRPLGSGTKWKLSPTPSTPGPEVGGNIDSPAFELLSPVLSSAVLPNAPDAAPAAHRTATPQLEPSKPIRKAVQDAETPVPKRRGRPPRSSQKAGDTSSLIPVPQPMAPVPVRSPVGETSHPGKEPDSTVIKHEEMTPRPPTETGDTTADESVTGRRQVSRMAKRKRQDTASPTPVESREPTEPPSHVLWTRSFHKVSHSAMEQIIAHRDAGMFANHIRERDAPGYHALVLQPQDLKSIRAAINQGNRAAAAAAQALDGGDPGTSSVWLPIGEELVPPRGIINSAQLDRELAHMFSNAIMYNPDPNRGLGPSFMKPEEEDDEPDGEEGERILGYKVDENGIVNNARAMFVEVEKLLSDMRSAEIQRGAPAAPNTATATGNSTRQVSVAGALSETPVRKDEPGSSVFGAEDAEDRAEEVMNTSKRRRVARA